MIDERWTEDQSDPFLYGLFYNSTRPIKNLSRQFHLLKTIERTGIGSRWSDILERQDVLKDVQIVLVSIFKSHSKRNHFKY